jgi:hypothetical protein
MPGFRSFSALRSTPVSFNPRLLLNPINERPWQSGGVEECRYAFRSYPPPTIGQQHRSANLESTSSRLNWNWRCTTSTQRGANLCAICSGTYSTSVFLYNDENARYFSKKRTYANDPDLYSKDRDFFFPTSATEEQQKDLWNARSYLQSRRRRGLGISRRCAGLHCLGTSPAEPTVILIQRRDGLRLMREDHSCAINNSCSV